jgi:hypothetical protein
MSIFPTCEFPRLYRIPRFKINKSPHEVLLKIDRFPHGFPGLGSWNSLGSVTTTTRPQAAEKVLAKEGRHLVLNNQGSRGFDNEGILPAVR